MSATPAALQLRLLQTMVEVAAEKNSTLVLPFPVEMLRFFEAAASGEVSRPRAEEPRSEPLLSTNGQTSSPAASVAASSAASPAPSPVMGGSSDAP
jgi:hypothetical protein